MNEQTDTRKESPGEVLVAKSGLIQRDDFSYKSTYKNPFISFTLLDDSTKGEPERRKEAFLLKGIVMGPGEHVAVIQDLKGDAFILKRGESINDLKVISISRRSVKIRYKGKDYYLNAWEE